MPGCGLNTMEIIADSVLGTRSRQVFGSLKAALFFATASDCGGGVGERLILRE